MPAVANALCEHMENHGEIVIYQTDDGLTRIDVNMQNETVWLSLDQMAELFQRDKSTISRHIKNIYTEGELSRESTVANFTTVRNEGSRQVARTIEYFNLDVINCKFWSQHVSGVSP